MSQQLPEVRVFQAVEMAAQRLQRRKAEFIEEAEENECGGNMSREGSQ